MTKGKIRILLVEDSDADAELISRELKRDNLDFHILRIENKHDFSSALKTFSPHIILSDYSLPDFDSMTALEIAKKSTPKTPFVIVTGTLDEETAVECIKAGANDYVLKGRIFQLPHVVSAALKERKAHEERERSEKALRDSEVRYKTLFESAIDAIFLIYEGKIIECNKSTLEVFECPASYIIDKSPADVSPLYQYDGKPSREKAEALILEALQGKPQVFEWQHKKFSGELFEAEIHLHRVFIQDKPYVQVILRDITERKRSERELKTWADIFHSTKMGVAVVGPNAEKFWLMNQAFAAMHGYTIDELMGLPAKTVIAPEIQDKIGEQVELARIKGHHIFESKHMRKDGTIFPVMTDVTAVVDETGKTRLRVVNVQDITERKNLEKQLIQSQRMEGIGTLASGIAHDFNNILGIILGYSSFINKNKNNNEKIGKGVETIQKAVGRGANLVEQILTFARVTDITHESVDVNTMIEDLIRMLNDTFPKTISLFKDLDENVPRVSIQQSQLYQLLLNLCVNARDAMYDPARPDAAAGVLTLKTARIGVNDVRKRFPEAEDSDYVAISVSDTGRGIEKENLQRIFDPFYSTKEPGKGTGLGLAVVYGIIRSYKGLIDVESEVGKGTSFNLYLQVDKSERTDEESTIIDDVQTLEGNETILLVEDETMLLEILELTLSEKGYRILKATDGQKAVDMFHKYKDEIKLVISDMGLPKMSGFEVFIRLKAVRENVKVILASGYLDSEAKTQLFEAGVAEFIKKPYQPEKMLQLVRNVLDRPV